MQIGRRIYYDATTGHVLTDTGERMGDVVHTTYAQDFQTFSPLIMRDPATVGIIELDYGQHAVEFSSATSYRVNVTTEEIIFDYTPLEV